MRSVAQRREGHALGECPGLGGLLGLEPQVVGVDGVGVWGKETRSPL